MYWPARRQETLLTTAVYKFHPAFAGADYQVWLGDADGEPRDYGAMTLEGGDVMPIGKGAVLIGMGERSSRQAIVKVAQNLFEAGAAERVIIAVLPRSRAAMHLDTVFTFCNTDVLTAYAPVIDNARAISLRPDAKAPGGMSVHHETKGLVETIGSALGVEFLVRYRMRERFFSWASVTLGRAVRDGARFAYDQPLSLNLVTSWDFRPGWNAGLRYRYASGLPYTPVEGALYIGDTDTYTPVYGATNSARLASYQKLDVHLERSWALRRWTLVAFADGSPPATAVEIGRAQFFTTNRPTGAELMAQLRGN